VEGKRDVEADFLGSSRPIQDCCAGRCHGVDSLPS
jgi:hypothetical protein